MAAFGGLRVVRDSNVSKLSSPIPLISVAFFCSSTNSQIPTSDSLASAKHDGDASATFRREPRRPKDPEKIEDVICRMMANRAWTTRLQNSIRNLVPRFDHELVYNVIHGAKKSDHALQFFRWVERANLVQHNREAHHKIIEILGRASKLNHARCILLDMPKKGAEWDEDMWVLMIDSYGKAGIVQESVKMFEKMAEFGVERTVKAYDTLFKAILRRGRYMMAKRYFNKMLNEGIEPTRHTFNIMLWGFFLCGKVETANRFFEDMKSRGIAPDVVTYNTMINGYYRVKKMEEAEKYFTELKDMKFDPNVITFTTMIKGYVSVERIDDALRMFDEMKGLGVKPNATTFSTLLPGLCDADYMSQAQSVLKEMAERYIVPNGNSIFMRLLSGQCKAGNLDAAADVLKAMIRLSIPTEAGHYGILIENFCKGGRYEGAVKYLDKLIAKDIILRPESTLHMEASSYNTIVEYLCSNGQTAKAETLVRQLMKLGVQDPVALNNLICGHSREGAPESASEILRIMIRRNVSLEKGSYESLVQSYLSKNDPSEAKAALESMVENGHVPDSSLYRTVMDSLFEDGRVQSASRVMKMMLERNMNDHKDLMFKILEALFIRGHVEEALGRSELLMHSGVAPEFDALISILCDKGKATVALKLLDFCLERDYIVEISSYEKVLDTLLAAGQSLNAYSILSKIMNKGKTTDWSCCKDLIKSLNEGGFTKQADNLSRMIKGTSKQPENKERRRKTAMAQ